MGRRQEFQQAAGMGWVSEERAYFVVVPVGFGLEGAAKEKRGID
jgi:hypothetical protein